ncbi:MAG: ribosome biogenesis GTP-binding protein YihA/YsxC [Alloprevotella sp.]|nr:ribosome biogenesis GTP-binding protein YihA/YsxC [Bacteroidales bacterium]MDY4663382.1 ribosome biogenesis GTP-binding protein YihA/YsxC [Alloprevotella sp.]
MIIKDAKFIISNSRADMCPKHDRPEYAFIGRSNVGKSSLINMLTGRKALAKTSSTPGKTLLINHFLINNDWYLVDLPGYGYAQRGKSEMSKLKSLIEHYVLERDELTCLFVLIDSRHELQAKDAEFIRMLGENGVPFGIIFTKADKLSKTAAKNNVENICKALSEEWEELPPYFVTSSATGLGKDDVLGFIDDCNKTTNE